MYSAGKRLRDAQAAERPLQIVGTINAYTALLAQQVGYTALYLSGAGVANASYGLPDLGMTSLDNVLEDVQRITSATDLPLLVDADTGWGGAFNIARTTRQLIKAGAGGMHLEDQVQAKRCGHRPGKALVSSAEMVDRIHAAVDARTDPYFVIMARTDAFALVSFEETLDRMQAYVEAGADMIFAEGLTSLEAYARCTAAMTVPILANITEFGVTPLFTRQALADVGISLILYPLSAFRAMNAAALAVYRTIRETGTQSTMIPHMQSRADLYETLNYLDYEQKLDALFKKEIN